MILIAFLVITLLLLLLSQSPKYEFLMTFRFLVMLYSTIGIVGLAFMPLTGFTNSIGIFAMSLGCLGVVILTKTFSVLPEMRGDYEYLIYSGEELLTEEEYTDFKVLLALEEGNIGITFLTLAIPFAILTAYSLSKLIKEKE